MKLTVLRILLYVLSLVQALVGLGLVFFTNWFLSYSPEGLPPPNNDFVVILLKGIGIIAVALGYLLCVAARDPVRYVSVIDMLVFVCIAAAVLEFYGAGSLNIGAYYPGPYLIVRAILQLILAVLLVVLRPKGATRAHTRRTG